ncbi:MAG: cupin [Pseudomonas oryzihabitans]
MLVAREALGSLEAYAHPFEAKALVIQGDLHVRTATGERHYRVGKVFHLAAQELHSERFGGEGARCLAGRRPA